MRNRKTEPRRLKLGQALKNLSLSPDRAGDLIGKTGETVRNFINGDHGRRPDSRENLRKLCRALMVYAAKLGYQPEPYHESELCPGEFPGPMQEAS